MERTESTTNQACQHKLKEVVKKSNRKLEEAKSRLAALGFQRTWNPVVPNDFLGDFHLSLQAEKKLRIFFVVFVISKNKSSPQQIGRSI